MVKKITAEENRDACTFGLRVLTKQAADRRGNKKNCVQGKISTRSSTKPLIFILSTSKKRKKLNSPFRKLLYVHMPERKGGGA